MDNAPYHNTSINKAPNTNSKKGVIQEWLSRNHIEYLPQYTIPQLLEIVKRNKPEPVYAIDAILKGLDHKEWRNYCSHVKKIQKEYHIRDAHLDVPFIIDLASDSEESSDGEDEDEEFDDIRPLNIVHLDHNYNKII
ncbi:unnamed protein product [Leptidea sinapis]|uniref:Tc1-like transposase DDE domain-containing protein n=1 Tax=Leptidea sinapis TaxID=189913 RepID=A0A5E4PPU2_9NEOP|nr:unnamed protein product [Leptidea sinapis]